MEQYMLQHVLAQSSTQADDQKYKDYLHWLHEASFVKLLTILLCKCRFSICTSWIIFEMHDHHLFQAANINNIRETVENGINLCSGCSNNCSAMHQLVVC